MQPVVCSQRKCYLYVGLATCIVSITQIHCVAELSFPHAAATAVRSFWINAGSKTHECLQTPVDFFKIRMDDKISAVIRINRIYAERQKFN